MSKPQSVESRIATLESTIEEQQELIEKLEERDDHHRAHLESLQHERTAGLSLPSVSRRTALSTVGLAGLVGLGATSGAAAPSGQVGTESRPVRELHAETVEASEMLVSANVSDVNGNSAVAINTTDIQGLHAVADMNGYNALYGENTATTGLSWGVRGDTGSSDEEAYGVRGMAFNGAATGVSGDTAGSTDGAAGVKGEATASSGPVHGVVGETSSTDNSASGVLGIAPGEGANGVTGLTSGTTQSVRADEAGVYGENDSTPGYGVFGYNTATSGVYAEGVYGLTDSPESAAITGENTDGGIGVSSVGSLKVDGHTDVSVVGADVYLSANQTITNGATTTVAFDSVNADHFGGFDAFTGKYTVQEDGDYHVSFTIDWQTNFSAGVHIDYELRINDSSNGGIQADTTTATSGQRVCRNFSRTLFGLSQGDLIDVAVAQESGDTADIFGSGQETYLSIFKAG